MVFFLINYIRLQCCGQVIQRKLASAVNYASLISHADDPLTYKRIKSKTLFCVSDCLHTSVLYHNNSQIFNYFINNTIVGTFIFTLYYLLNEKGGGPGVVVSTVSFHARVRGSFPGLGDLKETKMFLPHPLVKLNIVGSLCDREIACSASDL